jgi:dipeptidase E
MASGQIVAMGGGGFLMEADPRLDDYVLGLSGKTRPKVCFVPTASGDSESACFRFYAAFAGRAEVSHLALFNRGVKDLRAFVLSKDVIYVGGGNTANLLAVWRAHGLDEVLREAWQAGVVLAGVSAGSICWFDGGVTDSYGPGLAPLTSGLGFLPGSNCPHYDGEALRRPRFHELVAGGLPGGLAADDFAALHFEGTALKAVVASREDARAYRVEKVGNEVREEPLAARLL